MKRGSEAVVAIEEVKEAIETVRVIDTETETGTENAVVREIAKEPIAVTDMMVQMANMVTRIVTAKGTATTRSVIAGAREGTIMRHLNVVRMTELREKSQKCPTSIRLRHRHLNYRLHLHVIVPVRFVHQTEETATCERSTTIHQEAKEIGVKVATISMMMIL